MLNYYYRGSIELFIKKVLKKSSVKLRFQINSTPKYKSEYVLGTSNSDAEKYSCLFEGDPFFLNFPSQGWGKEWIASQLLKMLYLLLSLRLEKKIFKLPILIKSGTMRSISKIFINQVIMPFSALFWLHQMQKDPLSKFAQHPTTTT